MKIHVKPGETVWAGEPLLTLFTDDADRIPGALEALSGGIEYGEVAHQPLIIDRIGA